ncbi:RES family NAD+ phosphorylase [Pelotomaculum terephthalicicum JT]|uniref:RES family NAD+ phosphorylase n=1 Tax=Pelotomaculum TaxID=191373 RepID=UPI001F0382FA|nr:MULTISPECIES: RES family NAD+ phosphorylase [Pelotomaculum]MCG9967438.1 RES family NAD+ phosphorylase [Pelotomaculum terephthalicicum JT]
MDPEVKSIISSSKTIGNCDFCHKQDVPVLDIDMDSIALTDLVNLFDGLLDVYTESTNLPDNYPRHKINMLKNILHDDWYIFNCDADTIHRLLVGICKERYESEPNLFNFPVGIVELSQEDYLNQFSIMRTYDWEDFLAEIKTQNRFHTDMFNTKVMDQFFEPMRKTLKKGSVFYRARICTNEKGFSPNEMGPPLAGVATAGRANSEGISRLYLADSIETTLHEIRAAAYDYVTVGTFCLHEDIEIVNFTMIDKISPFFGIDFTQQAINLKHLRRIGLEISKPLRRHDSPLDYLPSQYICDYIKSQGYDGVEYASTMYPVGFNLAVFNKAKLECVDAVVYDVQSLSYTYKRLSRPHGS